MIVALMIGRKGSKGFPNKNIKKILGRSMCEYPLLAAKKSKFVKKIFVATDCEKIKKISKRYSSIIIDRPNYLNGDKALGEDVFHYGYKIISNHLEQKIEFYVLLHANSPTISNKLIDKAILFLRKNKKIDSAVTVSIYNMWSPIRARKLQKNGLLKPAISFKNFIKNGKINCDRDSWGNIYFADMALSVVRPRCLENISKGLLPQKWMGKKISPILNIGGLDVDYSWQVPQAEYWLRKNGFKSFKQ